MQKSYVFDNDDYKDSCLKLQLKNIDNVKKS